MSVYRGNRPLYADLGVGGMLFFPPPLFSRVLRFIDMFTSVKDTVAIPECLFDRQQESSKTSTFPAQIGHKTVAWI